ncbi:MAG: glycosyltransferase [Erysipelotrichales bacterium]|nr:glycosyltransferase [Erysipelotrichales bacterium]
MIIGQFADVFPPEIDGVGMVVNAYCDTFTKQGKDTCYYIAPANPKYEGTKEYPVINFASLPMPHEAYRMGLPAIDPKLQLELSKINFDVIHAHSPFTAGHYAALQADAHNLPLVATFHSKYYDDFLVKTGSEFLANVGVKYIVNFYNVCDEVWAVNEATAKVLHDYGFEKEIQVMPNGTNLWYPTEEDKKAAEERFQLGEGKVLLFVGQHNFKKNTRHIIEALKIYADTGAKFRMVFAGQGPDAEAMKQLVKDLGLDSCVSFVGHVIDRNILMGLYARADLLVFPSIYDNAPMVVREAAAAGTPSLLIRGSCAAEGVTDGYNGYLCEDTPESIEKTIERALSDPNDVGGNARNTIPMSWDAIINNVRGRYENLVRQYKSGEKTRTEDWLKPLTELFEQK